MIEKIGRGPTSGKSWGGEDEVSNCTCVYVGDGRVSALLLVRCAVKAN